MTETLNDLVQRFFDEAWEEFPEEASALGLDGYDDRLSEHSAEAYARREASEDAWLARFESVPDAGLSADEAIDRDLIVSMLRGDQAMRDWAVWKRNPGTYLGPGLGGVFSLFLHRVRDDHELALSAASRLKRVPSILEDGRRNIDPSLASPIFVERAKGMCAAAIHYARDLVPGEVADPDDRAVLAEAAELAARAFEDFNGFLGTLEPAGPYAIGAERYSAVLRDKEMLGYGAEEMRERGREEYERIAADMRKRARDLRGTDDFIAVIEELNQDHPKTPDEMRDMYEEWTERARAFLIERNLVTLPEGERCLVEPSPPFQRPVLAVASYTPPPFFKPSLTGHFFVPYPPDGTSEDEIQKRLESNSIVTVPTTSVHEAYPGHHYHLITMGANPRIARKVVFSSYFGEGWALYVERMMLEEGFYDDPRHELGAYDARIFRAARIVVDTSLHIGDMSFDEAVTFMMEKTGIAEPTARAEVGRYCSWPTQASSYLTGALEIERMRDAYLRAGRGDLRTFHDTLAASGSLPIALAERALNA
jgi:uncharacterized protein (DUF885 family)